MIAQVMMVTILRHMVGLLPSWYIREWCANAEEGLRGIDLCMTQDPLTHDPSNLAAYFSGLNASTIDREDDPSTDEDGHVITGTIVNRPGAETTVAPVRVRVGHGVGAQTASQMLRKMADMIDQNPEFLSETPGSAIRRLPDGSNLKKKLTIEGMKEVAEQLSVEERNRFYKMLDQIRVQIDDQDRPEPPSDPYYTPPSPPKRG